MVSCQATVAVLTIFAALCHAQQAIDPSYLQQYYQQVAAQAGHRAAAGAKPEVTPIFEPNPEVSQQYVQPGQQIKVRDNVHEQVRAQQLQHTQAYVAPQVRQYVQQPQPQQVQYAQQPQPAPKPASLRRPQPSYDPQDDKLNNENHEDFDPNPSYQFGFDVKDDEFTNYQNRKEVRDGNVIKGSYSVVDADGFIRTVKYTADPKEGFKAEVIREPTDIVIKFPNHAPQQQHSQQYVRQQQVAPQQFPAQQGHVKAPAQSQQYQFHQ